MDPLRRLTPPLALLLAMSAAGCTLPVLPSGGAGGEGGMGVPGTSRCPATSGQQVVERVNGIRAEHGLPPLIAEARLARAAVRHSEDQAANRYTGHIGSDGSTLGERARAAGYAWSMVAENVAQGYPTATSVVVGWMDSPSHRATILAPSPVHTGVGYAAGPAEAPHVWTLMVASPLGAGDAETRACHP